MHNKNHWTTKLQDGWGVLGGEDVGSGALLLDCDGTLAETERDGHRIAFNKAFEEPVGFREGGIPSNFQQVISLGRANKFNFFI